MKVLDSLFCSLANADLYNIAEKEAAKLSSEMITETLLRIEKVSFSVSTDEKVVHSMEMFNDDDDVAVAESIE